MKCSSISHPPENSAMGMPQLLGSGDPDVMSLGMALRGKNHMLIALLVHSVA
jgi:hypothetical protein